MLNSHINEQDRSKVHKEGAKQRDSTLGFNIHVLTQLKVAFDVADADGSGALDEQEFVSAFRSVKEVSQTATEEQIQHLFMKIDANSDGTVDWDEFTNHMLLEQGRKLAEDDGTLDGTELYAERLFDTDCSSPTAKGILSALSPIKKHSTSTVTSTNTPPSFSSPSKLRKSFSSFSSPSSGTFDSPGGVGSVHSPHANRSHRSNSHRDATMHLKLERIQREREKGMEQEQHGEMLERLAHVTELGLFVTAGRDGYIRQWSDSTLSPLRSFKNSNAWLTDVSYVQGARSLAVASMDRSITFYDVNSANMDITGRLQNLDGAPMCLSWLVDRDREMLMFGDDTGVMHSYGIDENFMSGHANINSPAPSIMKHAHSPSSIVINRAGGNTHSPAHGVTLERFNGNGSIGSTSSILAGFDLSVETHIDTNEPAKHVHSGDLKRKYEQNHREQRC